MSRLAIQPVLVDEFMHDFDNVKIALMALSTLTVIIGSGRSLALKKYR